MAPRDFDDGDTPGRLTGAAARTRISRWSATFRDPSTEALYRRQFGAEWRRVNLVGIAVLAGFMVLVHVSDMVRMGWTAELAVMGAIRLGVLAAAGVVLFRLWRRIGGAATDLPVLLFLLVFDIAFAVLTSLRELDPVRDDPLTYQVLGIALILASYLFFTMRFALTVVAGLAATVAYNAGSLANPGLPNPDTAISFALQILGNALLAFTVYRFQILRRRQFASYLAEKEARLALSESRLELLAAARSLERSRDEALGATQSKSDFLAQTSHELRSPLNAIIGFSEIMRTRTLGPADFGPYDSYVDDIGTSAAHLLAVINDLLDLSKIEAGHFELNEDEFSAAEVVRDAVRMVRDRSRAGALDLAVGDIDPAFTLLADERIIRQVLINLLTNAIKFTPAGGRIDLAVSELAGGGVAGGGLAGGGLAISIADTGQGIAAEDLPRVMELYGRADQARRLRAEGTGLGLPMARMMMELHGGNLSIQSELGAGTTVSLYLPPVRVVRRPAPLQDNVA